MCVRWSRAREVAYTDARVIFALEYIMIYNCIQFFGLYVPHSLPIFT